MLIVVAAVGAAMPSPGVALDIQVFPGDPGCSSDLEQGRYCDLREAVSAANALPAAGEAVVIRLQPGARYELIEVDHRHEGDNGLPAVTGRLTIEGHGAVIERSTDVPFRLMRVDTGGELTLKDVTLRNGSTAKGFDGAAIFNKGTLVIERSILEDNHSGDDGGAIRSDGSLRLTDSLVKGNSARWRGGVGGGLQSTIRFGKAVTLIERTTFEGNEAWAGGGAMWLEGPSVLTNATLTGNRAGDRGGAIQNYGALELRNSTITNNQAGVNAGGVHTFGSATLANTILAGNRAMISADCTGRFVSHGYNILGKLYRCVVDGDQAGNLIDVDVKLGPVRGQDASRVHLPAKDSPAVNAGNPDAPGSSDYSCDVVDQNGVERGKATGRCDIGALEVDPAG